MAAKGNDTKILHTSDRQLQVAENTRKPRIRWTPGLHNCFIKAVDRLGGPFEATPKEIMTQMDIPEVTSSHIKSHLQKYRLRMGCNSGTAADSTVARKAATNTMFEADDGSNTAGWHTNESIQLMQAQRTKFEGKRKICKKKNSDNVGQHQVQCNGDKNFHTSTGHQRGKGKKRAEDEDVFHLERQNGQEKQSDHHLQRPLFNLNAPALDEHQPGWDCEISFHLRS
ncbi:protein PHR1-LIKE 3-like isoform X2 [Coffea eugenioides]|uniref:Probable transcription factor KAN4 n=1 Tax=Coffea arabica TaxID=13443 RepID=A0A6P6TM91_COFAR|nr:protein PHR1-LIKE 3-like isoform X3 [Coffea arabica]XP_027149260.1 protein PHR1-LIKE 3-like isoform X2 [Coffea eugenioides]